MSYLTYSPTLPLTCLYSTSSTQFTANLAFMNTAQHLLSQSRPLWSQVSGSNASYPYLHVVITIGAYRVSRVHQEFYYNLGKANERPTVLRNIDLGEGWDIQSSPNRLLPSAISFFSWNPLHARESPTHMISRGR